MTDVQVVLTSTVTALSGQVTDVKDVPESDGTVVLFSTDSARWTEDSRYVRAARPDAQGQWQIKGVPSGEYFVVALDAVEDGQWFESEFLESIRDQAMRVTLVEGQPQAAQLKLATVGQQ